MEAIRTDVLIIGGGLTGLTLAYYLKNLNVSVKIIEASNRIGGRVLTKYNSTQTPIELGATWLVSQQISALKLLKELNIDVFHQYYGNTAIYHPNPNQTAKLVQLPANNSVSYRIKNGTESVIIALANQLPKDTIKLNKVIQSIQTSNHGLIAKTNDVEYHSNQIISTLPPFLFLKSVTVVPTLPKLLQETMRKTHTWMKDSIRVGFTYKTAFWKEDNTSGTIYSNTGPLQEFYDHSNAKNTLHALSGFMNASFADLSKEERQTLALQQLQSYYGEQALQFESYEECVWKEQKFTTVNSDKYLMSQQNNGHPLYQESYLNKRLFIAGTETSPVFSGKMEGAITSAQFVFEQLKAIYH